MTEDKFLKKPVEISKKLGVSERTISRWSNKGEVIKEGRGKYCILSVFTRYRRLLLEQIGNITEKLGIAKNNSVKKSLQQEKLESTIKIITGNAQIKEHELKIKEANLVDRDDAERLYRQACADFRAQAKKLPEQLAQQIATMSDPNEIDDLLEKNINQLLTKLSM